MLKSKKPPRLVRSYLVTCSNENGKVELIPMLGFGRGEVALTTKEIWPHLAILNVTENSDWND